MTVLVVDDSKAMRTIFKKILESAGAKVEEAGNGQEELDKLNMGIPLDIVLVDWNIPEMSGLDFVRAVRANTRYQKLPLMMVTAETEKSQVGKAFAAGANEYVMNRLPKRPGKIENLGNSIIRCNMVSAHMA